MSIRLYDEALVEKIQRWVKDPNMRVLSPSDSTRLFQMNADLNDDKPLTLPLVALSRDPDIEITSTARKALTYDGAKLHVTKEASKILNAIPMKLSYQLDIYCRYFAEADEYARNFLFNFINHPNIEITLPYNGTELKHSSAVLVENTVSDNSDIPQRLIPGQFYRMTIKLYIDDAYMFSIPVKNNWKIQFTGVEIEE